jgi:Protein of unknown function (DUF2808)
MIPKKLLLGASLSLLSLCSSALMAKADGGLTIFSGVDRKDNLSYHLDFGGNPHQTDRYKLYIPAKKLSQGASRFFVSYPDYFDGIFDTKSVEVRVGDQSLPLKDVVLDKESHYLEIDLKDPIKSATEATIVLSNVENPHTGTYYFVGDAQISGEIPVRVYLGTWIISIDRN